MLVQDMNNKNILDGIEQYDARRQAVVKYILRTIRTHNSYIYKFIFCEVLNLVNILFQVGPYPLKSVCTLYFQRLRTRLSKCNTVFHN